MRYIAYFLLLVIAAFNYQLWFGKGGWNDVWELEQQIEQQKIINEQQKQQNRAMAGEVQNLKDGGEALMEVARKDFGYVRQDEVFYRIAD